MITVLWITAILQFLSYTGDGAVVTVKITWHLAIVYAGCGYDLRKSGVLSLCQLIII
jgi:hypothetical protein